VSVRIPVLAAALALLAAAPAAAQTLEGRAVERGSLQPVPGAVIVLLDSAGAELAAAQTDSAGAFRLAAPGAGSYSLSTRRVGYHPTVTRAVPLAAGETVPVELRMTLQPVALDTVSVQGRARAGISGVLVDNRTGRPVADARVTLRDSRERPVARTRTDTTGAFHVPVRAADGYTLLAERSGYQGSESGVITVTPADTVRVELRVATDAVVLAPLTVVSASAQLMRDHQLAGFEWRRGHQPWGRFMGKDEIKRLNPFHASDVLQHIPSVQVHGGLERTVTLPMRGAGAGRRCIPTLYVDGRAVRMRPIVAGGGRGLSAGNDFTIDGMVPGSAMAAVEVYATPQLAPGEFPPLDNPDCGVVVIWTQVPDERSE
jgi:hypothetical protein